MSRLLVILTFFTLTARSQHKDLPFVQDFSVKYYLPAGESGRQIAADRNGTFRVLSDKGLLLPTHGEFLHPGGFAPDQRYRTAAPKKIQFLTSLDDQYLFATASHMFAQAWAGTLHLPLPLAQVKAFAGTSPADFVLSDGKGIAVRNSQTVEAGKNSGVQVLPAGSEPILDIQYHENQYYIVRSSSIQTLKGQTLYRGEGILSLAVHADVLYIGTKQGLVRKSREKTETLVALPSLHLNHLKWIGDRLWAGTPEGAFTLEKNGRINYYAGERWLPSDTVVQIIPGPKNSVLVLSTGGVGHIHFTSMTLKEKAAFFQEQVRSRHIRNGFNATLSGMKKGDLSSGYLSDSDNDGLWTSMYLAAEALRFTLTAAEDAKRNTEESLAAMERLFTVHHLPGFPARSFERSGFKAALSDPERWQSAPDPEWDWKATTSSDEAIGTGSRCGPEKQGHPANGYPHGAHR